MAIAPDAATITGKNSFNILHHHHRLTKTANIIMCNKWTVLTSRNGIESNF